MNSNYSIRVQAIETCVVDGQLDATSGTCRSRVTTLVGAPCPVCVTCMYQKGYTKKRPSRRRLTLLDITALGEAGPGLAVVLPASLELQHGGGAAVTVDDATIPGQRLGQTLGFALDAHLHGRRVDGLVRAVAVAGDDAPVDHLGRHHVDDGVVDFSHRARLSRL